MASIMDIGEKDCIHPANKKAGGDRLAFLALANTYGKTGFAGSGPVLKEMTVSGPVVKLTFNNAVKWSYFLWKRIVVLRGCRSK